MPTEGFLPMNDRQNLMVERNDGGGGNRTRARFLPKRSTREYLKGLVCGLILGGLLIAGTGKARGEFRQVPHWWVHEALCVHSYEGSWRDPNGPYYGGLQMDMTFMRHHGGWMLKHYGTADHWSPRAQLIIAYRGWRSQGWSAWPNTSRRCGLR